MQKSFNYIDVDLNCLYGEVLGTYVSRKASFCFLQLEQMLLHWWQFRVVYDYLSAWISVYLVGSPLTEGFSILKSLC